MAGQSFGDQLPYSRETLDQMKRRAEIRKRLKHEYYHYYRNPLAGSYLIDTYDPAHQRLHAALTYQPSQLNYFVKTRSFVLYLGFFIGVPYLLGTLQYHFLTGPKCDKICTGEISLKQRMEDRLVNGV